MIEEIPSLSVITVMTSLEIEMQDVYDLMAEKTLTPYVRCSGVWTIRNARKHSGLPIMFKQTQIEDLKRARRNHV